MNVSIKGDGWPFALKEYRAKVTFLIPNSNKVHQFTTGSIFATSMTEAEIKAETIARRAHDQKIYRTCPVKVVVTHIGEEP